MADIDDTDETPSRSLFIFGRDVSKIPCFRSSFLYGIGSGIGIGLFTFMATSKPIMGSHAGVASFTLITLCSWSYCRYDYSREKFSVEQLQEGIRQNALYQGTDKHRRIKEEFERESKDA